MVWEVMNIYIDIDRLNEKLGEVGGVFIGIGD